MVLFNSLYYKKNYLSGGQAIIMPGIVEVSKLFKIFENKDFPKQPIKEALKVIKILNKLMEPGGGPIKIKQEINKPIQIYIISAAAYSIYNYIKNI